MTTSKKQKDQDLPFTGGAYLIGFEKVIHHLMMCNELVNGRNAYIVSFAGNNSGLSFGGNQMDMHGDPTHIKLFVEILENATDNKGSKIFQKNEIASITGQDHAVLTTQGKTPKAVFGKNLDRINAALSSQYGITAINAVYPQTIKNGIAHVEKIVQSMKNPAAKTFYSTDFGKALLFEYHNQFSLNAKGAFIRKYIDGSFNKTGKIVHAIKVEKGIIKKITAPTKIYTFKDHQKYIHSTKEWYQEKKRVDTRLSHGVTILNQYGLHDNGPLCLSEAKIDSRNTPIQCPMGEHPVRTHPVHRLPTKKHPLGLVIQRVAHCARNPIRKDQITSVIV